MISSVWPFDTPGVYGSGLLAALVSDITWATLVDVEDLGGILISIGHVVPVPNGPSQVGVMGG